MLMLLSIWWVLRTQVVKAVVPLEKRPKTNAAIRDAIPRSLNSARITLVEAEVSKRRCGRRAL